jgi:hypothetical protein
MSVAMAQPTDTLSSLTLRSAAHATTHAHQSTHLSGGAIALAAVSALVVLACVAWGLARMLTFEPHWTLSLRHALAEASFRVSATWAEFSDWARLGQ